MGCVSRGGKRASVSCSSRGRASGRGQHASMQVLESRRLLASTLVPVTGAMDLIYDPTRNDLYVTTDSGSLARYDLDTRQLLVPIQAGTKLRGGDITPDGKYLYIADTGNNAIRKVDLANGQATTLSSVGAAWDLKIGADNMIFVTDGPLKINADTGEVTYLGELGSCWYGSIVARSADYRTCVH